jgi:tetratricopeptide (TPR) repeat protein
VDDLTAEYWNLTVPDIENSATHLVTKPLGETSRLLFTHERKHSNHGPTQHQKCRISRDLPEAHVAKAFLLWSPSKNFQHLDAIGELRKAIALQKNLPHAYNRLGTILAHIGLLDRAREMYERGRPFQPKYAVNHSIVQVYIWNREIDSALEQIRAWRAESPGNKYAIYFAPQPAMMIGDWKEARVLLDEAIDLLPEEPLIVSLLGVYWALLGNAKRSLQCVARACSTAKSFGHGHHTYYQLACIFALLGRHDVAFEWLERSVNTGFACWPFS